MYASDSMVAVAIWVRMMKPLGIELYVIEWSTRMMTKIRMMFATWPRSTSSLIAARMPITPPAITNCAPRVQDLVGW